MARGTPLKWIKAQGGRTTAKLLLDVYGHFLPSEYTGYADALSRPAGAPYTHPEALAPADARANRTTSAPGGTGFRPSAFADDAQIPDNALHRAAALLEELGDVDGDWADAAVADLIPDQRVPRSAQASSRDDACFTRSRSATSVRLARQKKSPDTP